MPSTLFSGLGSTRRLSLLELLAFALCCWSQKSDPQVAPSLQKHGCLGVRGPWGLGASECGDLGLPMRWGHSEHWNRCETTQRSSCGISLLWGLVSPPACPSQASCQGTVFCTCLLSIRRVPGAVPGHWRTQKSRMLSLPCLHGIWKISARVESRCTGHVVLNTCSFCLWVLPHVLGQEGVSCAQK